MNCAHGKIQRALCWIGLHPNCCFKRHGIMQMLQTCDNCGMEDAGP